MTATLPSLAAMKPNPAWASLPLLDRTGWKRVWFGKRRAYQRKVAVAEFEAVVSGDIDVLAPKAFHYLSGLPLIHSKSSHGLSLGQLDFIQGDRPGSNLTYVRAEDHATLACLQHRLNELD